ncbi:MAG: hypothetical protein SVV67_05100 [Bacillota bacterium]|nr:hypothetical protein [Bacillota bacterium]
MQAEIKYQFVVSLVPIDTPNPEGGKTTRICYSDGKSVEVSRRVKTLLNNTANYFGINLARQRKRYGEYLQRRQGVPLPLSGNMVLVPLKMLNSSIYNDEVTGYVNACAVLRVVEASPEEKARGIRCTLQLKGGHLVPCCFSAENVNRKVKIALLALEHFRSLIGPPVEVPAFSLAKEGPVFLRNIDYTLSFLRELLKNSRHAFITVAEEEEPCSKKKDDPETFTKKDDSSETASKEEEPSKLSPTAKSSS